MNEITMIPVERLEHHPDNPRKDLGDLSEMVESIKAQGILQNLTIVESSIPGKWYVVIGNRRLEAAKLAGLDAVPCSISTMDAKEQMATMLSENMNRQDLTVYEQAQGFQMMMDLGFNEDQIAEKTGFSKTTVKRRLKMAELDQKQLKEACEGEHDRQITLGDFEQLARIDSIKQRNALLKEIGNSGFNFSMKRALNVQEANKNKKAILKILKEAGAALIKVEERYGHGYEGHWEWKISMYEWKEGNNFIPNVKEPLFYYMDDTDLYFYTKEKSKKEEKKERPKAEIEAEKARNEAWKQIDEDTKTADQLRKTFVANLKMSPKNAPVMLYNFLKVTSLRILDYSTPREHVREVIGVTSSNYAERMPEMAQKLSEFDITDIPKVIGAWFDGDRMDGYVDGVKSREMPKYKKNVIMDAYYEWLKSYGYQMSDVEIQLMNGTHPCFVKEKGHEDSGD